MRIILKSPWSYRIVRAVIGIIFIYAGITKLTDVHAFADIISLYDLVPEKMLTPVAFGLPALEILAGMGLILNMRGSRTAIVVMLLLFISVLWYGILKDLDIDCGCFSPEEINEHNSLRVAFYRDLAMLTAMVFLSFARWFCPSENARHGLWSRIKS
ncbi:MAG: MauE/DoxX family redox-associated membrane protein [Nitrospirota bacterium]